MDATRLTKSGPKFTKESGQAGVPESVYEYVKEPWRIHYPGTSGLEPGNGS